MQIFEITLAQQQDKYINITMITLLLASYRPMVTFCINTILNMGNVSLSTRSWTSCSPMTCYLPTGRSISRKTLPKVSNLWTKAAG